MSAMWQDIGIVRWPLLMSVLAIAVLVVFAGGTVFRSGASPDARTKAWIDAILFWGGFAAVSGFLGTLIRTTIAAQRVELAGEISTTLLWGGIKIALAISVWGIMILMVASICWFALQLRWKFLLAEATRARA